MREAALHIDAHAGHDSHTGHDRHAGHSVAMFRDKLWISLLLTLPTLVWGHMLQEGLGYTAPAAAAAE
jgi:Cu2+-exporting ATPase